MKKILFYLCIVLSIPHIFMAQTTNKKTTAQNKITISFLEGFAGAFNAHDANAILSFMTSDCIFEASAGPDVDGEKFTGQAAVKKAFEDVFKTYPDAHWGNARHFIAGDRGVSEWVFTGTKADSSKVEVTGCDLFTFRDGKIAIKNSYRKNRPVIPKS
jgi:ketosteroid isomerase-like protein